MSSTAGWKIRSSDFPILTPASWVGSSLSRNLSGIGKLERIRRVERLRLGDRRPFCQSITGGGAQTELDA